MIDTWFILIQYATPFGIMFLIAYSLFKTVSKTYAEAAKIDGAGNFAVCFKIYLPLAGNLFATVMLIQGITFWNDYQTPLLYLETYPTLAYWLYRFTESTKTALSFVPVKAAGAMLLVFPILLVFLFFNNRIMGNLSLGGLKE